MMKPRFSRAVRRAVLSLSLAFALAAVALPARADNPPKFKDPEVTTFFQKMSDTIDGLLAAVKAKDDAKVKELTNQLMETGKSGESLKSKVSPEEDAAASKWGEAQMQKLIDSGWSPTP